MGRWLWIAGLVLALGGSAQAARVKDIAEIAGVRENQLMGLGLVVGLNGTGDAGPFLSHALSNALRNLGINISPEQVRARNAALVYVTATLPPFSHAGSKIDVTVSSVGDARSLLGGTLLRTPLEGADGNVYAVAQGSLTVGGFSFGGEAASAQQNHPTVGRITNGAMVERVVPAVLLGPGNELVVVLHERSFLMAERLSRVISESLPVAATAIDSASVQVLVPDELTDSGQIVNLIARLGELEITPDVEARVVINERTGTIVAGEHVRVSRVAISHGNLTITVAEAPQVSQPLPFSDGETTVVPRTQLDVGQQRGPMHVLEPGITVADLAQALNELGVSSRDLVSIFQALKAAGALQAELVVL